MAKWMEWKGERGWEKLSVSLENVGPAVFFFMAGYQSCSASFSFGLLCLVFMKQKQEQQGHLNMNFISLLLCWLFEVTQKEKKSGDFKLTAFSSLHPPSHLYPHERGSLLKSKEAHITPALRGGMSIVICTSSASFIFPFEGIVRHMQKSCLAIVFFIFVWNFPLQRTLAAIFCLFYI
ncbi:hypothetical protein KSP40_PGU013641 [Platanthera guangdongensis]|uniref:Transmembrane protein n=1 Tax=Platanthera guangdongensis TaxID=2320717 RepID=A0ABR2MEA5_9ASPA